MLLISDLTGGLGGVYTYLQQIQSFIGKEISVHLLLETTTHKNVLEHFHFNSVDFVPLSNKFHKEKIIAESLKNEIKKHAPDVIHVVNGSIKSNLIIREYFAVNEISFIVTEQYVDETLLLDEILLSRIQKVNLFASHVIYVSNANFEIAKNVFGIETKNHSTIYNGILPFKQKKKIFSNKPVRIFSSGRCVPQKGIDTIIKAISLLPNNEIHFHLLGDGENKNEYLNLAEKTLKSNHHFVIEGWTKQINYTSVINNFDLYISASRQEGLSYSLLEAASAGFPMICSDCSGNVELIELCSRGNLFAKENFQELSNLLLNFLESPEELNKKAILNTALVDVEFNAEILISRLEEIYISNKQ